jgi:hypothetical protein
MRRPFYRPVKVLARLWRVRHTLWVVNPRQRLVAAPIEHKKLIYAQPISMLMITRIRVTHSDHSGKQMASA